MKTKPLELQFYTKPDCPLCDEAKLAMQVVTSKLSFLVIDEIDIFKESWSLYKIQTIDSCA